MFNFFRQATTVSTGAIRGNAGLIKSVKINFEPLVFSGVLQAIFSHFFEILIFIACLIYFKAFFIGILFYPFIFLLLIIFSTGISFSLSVLGVFMRDIENVWGIILNFLWLATPIFYFSDKDFLINKLNPIYYFIDIARDVVIYGKTPDNSLILASIILSVVSFVIGLIIFEKFKKKFAESL
jgi:ABC-type polysaccharide/polyol phosphate export permease